MSTEQVSYQTKKVRFGDKEVTMFSIDGVTWSSRQTELLEIKDRHENGRVSFNEKHEKRNMQKRRAPLAGEDDDAISKEDDELLEDELEDAEDAAEGDEDLDEDDLPIKPKKGADLKKALLEKKITKKLPPIKLAKVASIKGLEKKKNTVVTKVENKPAKKLPLAAKKSVTEAKSAPAAKSTPVKSMPIKTIPVKPVAVKAPPVKKVAKKQAPAAIAKAVKKAAVKPKKAAKPAKKKK